MLPLVDYPRYFGFSGISDLRERFGIGTNISDDEVIFASIGEMSVFVLVNYGRLHVVSDIICARCGLKGAFAPEPIDWDALSRHDFTPTGFLSDHLSEARARIASIVVQNLPANREAFDGGPRIGKTVKVPPSMFGVAPGATPLSEYVIAGFNQAGEIELVPAARS